MHPHDGGLSPDSDVGTLAPKDRKLIPGPVTILVRLSLASLQDLGSVRGCTNSGQPHWSNCRKKNFMYEYHPGCYCARCKNKRQATSHKLQAKVASIKQLLTKLFYKII